MGQQVLAPFTAEQVGKLNAWQTCGWVHPFTCARRDKPGHMIRIAADRGQLIATEAGWICPDCDYTQSWARDYMLEGPPPNPFRHKEEDEPYIEILRAALAELLDEYIDALTQGAGEAPFSSPHWHMFMSTYEHAERVIPRMQAILKTVEERGLST